MRGAVSCLLLAAAGPVMSAATSATAAAAAGRSTLRRSPDFDMSGLGDALKSGGAEGLLKALSAVNANKKNQDANMNIKRDANGRAMYNFVVDPTTVPPTTQAPATTPALPVVSAAADDSDDDDNSAAVKAAPAAPVAPAAPGAAAPVVAAAAAVPLAAPVAAGGSFAGLAAGLAAVRQQVDTLSSQADAAMRGVPMPAAGVLAAAPSAQTEAEVQSVLKRVQALEEENKKLHGQVTSEGTRLDKMEAAQKADEEDISKEKLENESLKKALEHRRKHHKGVQKQGTAKAAKKVKAVTGAADQD